MILYADPARQAKLEEAIRLGFINRTVHADGVPCYTLTQKGIQQWIHEKIQASVQAGTAWHG